MIEAKTAKYVQVVAPISVAGGATATATEIDTLGFDYVEFIFLAGLIPATGFASIKLQESDVAGSGQVDISGAAFTALVDADDGKILSCTLDMRKRKRYLTLVAVNGATNASLMAAFVRLSRAELVPATLTARGFAQELSV